MQITNSVAGQGSLDASAPSSPSHPSPASGITFADLGLSSGTLAALTAEGYVDPTPIQQKAIPHVLAGRDLLGCAQTGTGKTAAFAVPMIERLLASRTVRDARRPRSLVLSPTRELSAQIAESFQSYGRGSNLKGAVIFGGVGQGPQISALSRGLDVLVATPGRLIDLLNQGAVFLDKVEILVLDEADRMLDMGFLPDVKRILQKLPKSRQTLFFSATMPSDIERLSREILVNPVRVDVAPVSSTAERIEQSVYMVEASEKRRILERVLRDPAVERAIVFTRTKHGANRLVTELSRGEIMAEAIHGNKSQGARQRALDNFKSGRLRVLVATDIAARGIDVDGISHVINYDLPNVPESYVHRIGRTARAGAAGIAISLCSREERAYLRDIERLTRTPILKLEAPEATAEENRARAARPQEAEARSPQRPPGGDRGGQGQRGSSRGPAPRRQFDDRAASPRPPRPSGPAPRPQAAAPSRFDGDRGPSRERQFDDRSPRQFDDRSPRQFDGRSPRPQAPQAPREHRGAPARNPVKPEVFVRRSR